MSTTTTTNKFQEYEMFARDWYDHSRSLIPPFPSRQFNGFAARSTGILYHVTGAGRMLTLKVDGKAESAAIDRTHGVVILPGFYFIGETYERMAPEHEDTAALAISVINGSLVHEGLHEKLSPTTLVELVKSSMIGSKTYDEYGDLLIAVANTIEDLYIEAIGRALFPSYSVFMEAKNAVLLNEEAIAMAASAYDENATLENAASVAITYKNTNLRDHEAFSNLPIRCLSILKEVGNTRTRMTEQRRSELIAQFALQFTAPEKVTKTGDGSFGGCGCEAEGEAAAMAKMMGGDPTSEDEMKRITAEFEDENEDEFKAARVDRVEVNGRSFAAPKTVSVMKEWSRRGYKNVEIDFGFLRRLREMRTKNRVPGEALTRGAHIVNTRLSRIATDGKIFSRKNAQLEMPARVEIIILGDASGSMSYNDTGEWGVSLFSLTVGTTKAMHESLRKAGIANSVFFHTTKMDGSAPYGHVPTLFDIAQYDMERTDSQLDERFQRTAGINTSENYDGIILEEVVKHFTTKTAIKVVIVLSDGAPSGPGYNGSSANEHTRKVITNLRKRGFKVICLSLVDGVVEQNSKIYGRGNNVNASGDLVKEFERVIENIQKEVK